MNLSVISKSKLILLAIVLIAFLLRSVNLTVGFPGLFISNDEAILHQSALNMLANKTVFTLGNYGPFGSYVQIPLLIISYFTLLVSGQVNSIKQLEFLLLTQEGYFLIIPRLISALFGTLTVLVVFRLSLTLSGKKHVALISSFFAAVSFNLVHISHLARTMSPALFFCTLTSLFAVYAYRSSKPLKNLSLSLAFSALAFGFHQVAGLAVFFPIFIAAHKYKSVPKARFLFILGLWMIVILTLNYLSLGGNINNVFKPNNAINTIGLIRTPQFWLGMSATELTKTLLDNFKLLWELTFTEGVILLMAGWGLLADKKDIVLRKMFLLYFCLSLLFAMFIFPPLLRYSLWAIVFLPIFAGIGVGTAFQKKAAITIVILLSAFNTTYFVYTISKESTFSQMRRWVDVNIEPEAPILASTYRFVGYAPSKNASRAAWPIKPNYYKRLSQNLSPDQYPYNVRNIFYLDVFKNDNKVDNLNDSLKVFPSVYLIDVYNRKPERLLAKRHDLKLLAHFSPTDGWVSENRIPQAFADAPEFFPPFVLDRTGPYIDIIEIEK